MINILYLIKAFILATQRFFIEKYTLRVSALAFTTLLSLVPLLSISVFFIAIVPVFSNFILLSQDYIFKNFVPASASSIQLYFQNFIQQSVNLPIVSIAFLILTAILLINMIDETINDIWHVTKRRRRMVAWLFYAVIALSAPVLIGLSVFITSYVFSFCCFTKSSSFLLFILPVIINTIMFSLFYIFSPNTYVNKTAGIIGGFIAALLIEIARLLFAIYVSYFSNYKFIYGMFSILPIFLIWLYICWFIILWSAVFTYILSRNNL